MDKNKFEHYLEVNKEMANHTEKICNEIPDMEDYTVFVSVKPCDWSAHTGRQFVRITCANHNDPMDLGQASIPADIFLAGVDAYVEYLKDLRAKMNIRFDETQHTELKRLMDLYPEVAKQHLADKE